METLATIHPSIQDIFEGQVKVKLWTQSDPFPILGPTVGVDTETELFTETNMAPPLVVLGVFDPQSATCYISYWEDAAVFIAELSKRDVIQFYFNLGFDEQVLDNEDKEKSLLDAVEYGRVRDMQIRIQLNDIATVGYIPWNHWSLEDCSNNLIHVQLDKGEKGDEESHRMTFRRGTPITEKQAEYLAWDCISTWALGIKVPEQATEVQHTKGMIVLAHTSNNGFNVDQRVFDAFEAKLQAQRDEYRLKLLDFGFPDPYKKDKDENGEYKDFVALQARAFCQNSECSGTLNLCKANMRMALVYMYNFAEEAQEVRDFEDSVAYWLCHEKPKNLRKAEEKIFYAMVEEYGILGLFNAGKEIVMNALLGHVLEDLAAQRSTTDLSRGYDLKHAIEHAEEIINAHPNWTDNEKPVGPKTYLQNHITNLLKQNPKLELEKTEKSGDWKLTLKDMWRLEDAGVQDPFMTVYTTYCHCTKYLSTYLNREFVREDGKIHAKFTNLMKTGRTSCTRPNLQNLPSRDKQYPLKNMFCAPEGAILCATDFSFIELCAFAQTCYSRFGFSVMRDVINAGLDPHRWFAGVMNKIITPDLSNKDDPKWVEETKAFLKANVSDALRQNAKAANYPEIGPSGSDPCRIRK